MDWKLYILLSGMMFLEFAIWGAWSPVLSSRLLGTLKMSGKQMGWVYGTLPLGCVIAPLVAGQLVDRWCPTEWYLGVSHLAGSVFLLGAARATRFRPLLVLMVLYALCFAPTLALVNALTFAHLATPEIHYFRIRVWGAISWIAAGWTLTLWRRSGRGKRLGDADALVMAGVLSAAMGLYCFFLPHTPPAHHGGAVFPFAQALSLFAKPNVAVFLVLSFVVSTQLQFYFLGTARYLEDVGISHTAVPAVMSVAQIAQIIAMACILPFLFQRLGYQWTLFFATGMWIALFLAYAFLQRQKLIIASMVLHGLAYAFFFDAGFLYIDRVAPTAVRASAQALYTTVTLGLGLFAGTQITGIVMDRFRRDARFLWRPIFLVPCALLAVCAFAFIAFFRE